MSDRIHPEREREKISDDVRSGILTVMCLEHIKTHIHFNFTRLSDYAAARSEIETFLGARLSSSSPDATDTGSLHGQKRCVSHLWTARTFGSRVSKTWQECSRRQREN